MCSIDNDYLTEESKIVNHNENIDQKYTKQLLNYLNLLHFLIGLMLVISVGQIFLEWY